MQKEIVIVGTNFKLHYDKKIPQINSLIVSYDGKHELFFDCEKGIAKYYLKNIEDFVHQLVPANSGFMEMAIQCLTPHETIEQQDTLTLSLINGHEWERELNLPIYMLWNPVKESFVDVLKSIIKKCSLVHESLKDIKLANPKQKVTFILFNY